jgi:outer membrane protein assembly factor BamA
LFRRGRNNKLAVLAIAAFLFSCSPTKKVKDGEYLLVKNVVEEKDAKLLPFGNDIDLGEIEAYIRQKPNRKVGPFRLHLGLYNMINENRLKQKKTRRDKRFDRIDARKEKKYQKKNVKRQRHGKPLLIAPKKNKNRQTFREWVMDIGEPPVIYDSTLTRRSNRQIKLYLQNKGFFNCKVTDSTAYKKKKATAYYFVSPGKPYKIRNVSYQIADPLLAYYIFADTAGHLLKKGENYDVDNLTAERERISSQLKNSGYFNFIKEFIFYQIDSTAGNRQVDIDIIVKNPSIPVKGFKDSTTEASHTRYYIQNIYVNTSYNPKLKKQKFDTIRDPESGIYFLFSDRIRYKPKHLVTAIHLREGELFMNKNADATYQSLSELRAFKFININFRERGENQLDAYINLNPNVKQSFTVESEGTNTGGNLGVSGSFIYQNRNVFRGAEVFEFKLKGGLEIQQSATVSSSQQNNIGGDFIPFNTLEFGPEMNLHVPRFITPFKIRTGKNANPKTIFSAAVNYQERPSFDRTSVLTSLGYTWRETAYKKHAVYPIELNLIALDPKKEFELFLQNNTDPFIAFRYRDYFTLGSRYSFIYSNQDINRKRSFLYFRGGAEAAGNTLRGIFNLVDQYVSKLPYDQGYLIGKIRFAQYLRGETDLRYYKVFRDNNSLVSRIFVGVGKPLHNFRELPFQKSFFSGGPNSVRAWKARTIGPGSYTSPVITNFDQVGDNQLELNIEYRFNIIKVVNAAIFADAGNVWMRKEIAEKPGADFNITRFYQELAMGSGLGLRLDFSFFIIRLDMGIKMFDPEFRLQDRWVIVNILDNDWKRNYITSTGVPPTERYSFLNFNFGIGYPF